MALLLGGLGVTVSAAYYITKTSKFEDNNRVPAPIATTVKALDKTIVDVAENASKWVELPPAEKLALLKEMKEILNDIKDEVGPKSDELRGYKGTVSEGYGTVLALMPAAAFLKGLIENYTSIVNTGKNAPVMGTRKVGDCEVVNVHPRAGMFEKATNALEVELWGEDGKSTAQTALPQKAGVTAVLCAGNFEGPVDVFHKMFIENQVVICKNHPINALCTDVLHAKLLAPLARRGFVGLCSGGINISAHLLNHEKVDTWMMTGGCATFDAITWGGAKGKAAGKQQLTKPCHAELGAATPYILAPGKWTDAEITYQAQILLGFKLFNSGHICASPQTILMDRQWPQAQQFLKALTDAAQAHPSINAYYPGAADRLAAVEANYPKHIKFDSTNLILVPDLDDGKDGDEYFVTTETFATALGVKYLDGNNDPLTFLTKAVAFCNEKCFGTLSGNVVIDPRTRKEMGDSFDSEVLGKLIYGVVGVNIWSCMAASNPYAIWGAHKDAHTVSDIQSGIGHMGNCLSVQNVKKCVIYGKWADPGPLQLFTQSNKTKAIGRAMGNMVINGGVGGLLTLIKALVFGKY